MPPRSPLSYDPYGLLSARPTVNTSQLPEDQRLAEELNGAPTIQKSWSNALAGQDYGSAVYDENEALQSGDVAALEAARMDRERFGLRSAASRPDGSTTLSGAMEKGDWGNFVQNTVGQTGYSMLPSVAAGALGGIAGSPLGTAGKLLTGLGAAGVSSYYQNRAGNAGQISHDEQLNSLTPEQKNQMASRTALVQAPLDSATALLGPLGKAIPGIAKAGVGTRVVGGSLGEGLTEGAQDLAFQTAGQQYFPERQIDTTSLMDNAAAGVLGGGAMSTLGLNREAPAAATAPRTDGVELGEPGVERLAPELLRANYNSGEEYQAAMDSIDGGVDLGGEPADNSFMGRARAAADSALNKARGFMPQAGGDIETSSDISLDEPVDLGGEPGMFDRAVARGTDLAAKAGIDTETLGYVREAVAHVAGQTKERSTAVLKQAMDLAAQGGVDPETIKQVSSAIAKAVASESKRAVAAAKVKATAAKGRGLSGMARDAMHSIKTAASGAADTSANAISEMLLQGDAHPKNVGATVEETQANIAANRTQRVHVANAMLQTLLQDDAVPTLVKNKLAGIGEITEENVNTAGTAVGAAMQSVIAAETMGERIDALLDAVKNIVPTSMRPAGKEDETDEETGGKIVGRRNNLMGGTRAERAAMYEIVLNGLTPEAAASEAVTSNLQTIANGVTALALRTGGITKADVDNVANIQDGLEIFADPVATAKQLLEVVAPGADNQAGFIMDVMSVTTASQDMRKNGENSFAFRMTTPEARSQNARALSVAIAKGIDNAVAELETGGSGRFSKALEGVYGSKERVDMVLDYYSAKMEDALTFEEDNSFELEAAANSEGVESVQNEREGGEQGMNEVDDEPADYMFAHPKQNRPFQTADAKGISDARREAVTAGRVTQETDFETIGMDQYVRESNENPERTLADIRTDVKDRMEESLLKLAKALGIGTKGDDKATILKEAYARAVSGVELKAKAGSKDDAAMIQKNILARAGELSMLNNVAKGEGTEAALKLYSVLKVSAAADKEATASDADIAAMGEDRDTKDVKTAKIRFITKSGKPLVLSAGSMVRVGMKADSLAVKDTGGNAFRRMAFANSLAAVLNRSDVVGLENPGMIAEAVIHDNFGKGKERKILTAGPQADSTKIAKRLKAKKENKAFIDKFNERLAALEDEYSNTDEQDLRDELELKVKGYMAKNSRRMDEYYEWLKKKIEVDNAPVKDWVAIKFLNANKPELSAAMVEVARYQNDEMFRALERMRDSAFEADVISKEGESEQELGTQGKTLDAEGARKFDENGDPTSSNLGFKPSKQARANVQYLNETNEDLNTERTDPLNGLTGRERTTAISRLMYANNRAKRELKNLESERTRDVERSPAEERMLAERINIARARADKAAAAYDAIRFENAPLELSPEQKALRAKELKALRARVQKSLKELEASGKSWTEAVQTAGTLRKGAEAREAAKTPEEKAFEAKLAEQNAADKREEENFKKPRKYDPLKDKGADVAAERAALDAADKARRADAKANPPGEKPARQPLSAKFKPFERKSLKAEAKSDKVGFKLTHTGMYTSKDQKKANRATAFIGRGSEKSSTNQYRKDAEAAGIPVNAAELSADDVVFVSAEGNREGRLKPQKGPLDAAIKAGATILTDNSQNRARNHNIGEREVAAYLTSQGYGEVNPGEWRPGTTEQGADADGKKQSAMAPRRGRRQGKKALNAEGRKILAEVQRIRGKDIKLRMRRLASEMQGASGEYYQILHSNGKVDRVIEVAVNAANPMSVAWHESLHDFFAMLNPSGKRDIRVKRDLNAVAGSPRVRQQLEQLLEGHPAALKQLDIAEERTAYMYQFWAAGLLEVNPKAAGWLEDIKALFKDLLGIVSQTERAEDLLQALHDGRFAEPSTVAYVLADMKGSSLMDKIENVSPAIAESLTALGTAAPDRLRAFQNEHLDKLADKFSSETGKLGFIQNRSRKVGYWSNELDKVLAGTTAEQRGAALQNLQAMRAPANALEKGIAKYLERMYEYMRDSGVMTAATQKDEKGNVVTKWEPLRKVEKGYFPRQWNASAITSNMAEWKALLKKHSNMDDAAIAQITAAITEGTEQIELAESRHALGFTPYAMSAQERGFKFIRPENAQDFMKFQSDNLADVLIGYTNQAVHRAEYSKEFGNDGEQINGLVQDAKLSNKQLEEVFKITGALEGTLGSNTMSRSTMELMSNVMTLQNVVLLPLTLFSQVIDPIVLAARSGNLRDAGTAYVEALKALKNFVTKSDDKTLGSDMAEMLGIVHNDSVLEAMGTAWGSTHMGSGARHVNRLFFKYNGMQGWNNVMRSVATHAGERYLLANKDNEIALKELGLTPADIKTGADGRLNVKNDKVKQAMFRFVDQAVLRPSASQRPVWMSDPRWMLVGHLKQFVFAMQNVVLKRANEQMELGNIKPWGILALAMPAILAADIAKGALTGSTQMNGWGFMDYLGHAMSRSGLLGVGDFGTQVFADAERGKLPGEGLIGPAGEHLATILRFLTDAPNTDAIDVINRTIPGARFVS